MNLTPNSFSDGGKIQSTAELKRQVSLLTKWPCDILDFGAESTAPMNKALSADEEIQRFRKILFPLLENQSFKFNRKVSIDTYRRETFLEVAAWFARYSPETPLIWNDVSGVLENDLISLLKNHKNWEYVFSHTYVPNREKTNSHMKYLTDLSGEDFVNDLEKHFQQVPQDHSQIFFDPCFGFSKTREQNLFLLKNLPTFIRRFSQNQKWLIGISKKSFLQSYFSNALDKREKQESSEYLHTLYLQRWINNLSGYQLSFRVHNPAIVYSAALFQ